jgi:VWFA-related protein
MILATSGVSVYAISIHDPRRAVQGDEVLRGLATSTGGRDFIVKDGAQMRDALAAIHEELRSSYVLYYHPPNDPAKRVFRNVRVLPAQNSGARIRSRQGYFSAP